MLGITRLRSTHSGSQTIRYCRRFQGIHAAPRLTAKGVGHLIGIDGSWGRGSNEPTGPASHQCPCVTDQARQGDPSGRPAGRPLIDLVLCAPRLELPGVDRDVGPQRRGRRPERRLPSTQPRDRSGRRERHGFNVTLPAPGAVAILRMVDTGTQNRRFESGGHWEHAAPFAPSHGCRATTYMPQASRLARHALTAGHRARLVEPAWDPRRLHTLEARMESWRRKQGRSVIRLS